MCEEKKWDRKTEEHMNGNKEGNMKEEGEWRDGEKELLMRMCK